MEKEWVEPSRKRLTENIRSASITDGSDNVVIVETSSPAIKISDLGTERLSGYGMKEVTRNSFRVIFPPGRIGEEVRIRERISKGERSDKFDSVGMRKENARSRVSVSVFSLRVGDVTVLVMRDDGVGGDVKFVRTIFSMFRQRHGGGKRQCF